MYFYYGIKHSSLEEGNKADSMDDVGTDNAGNIELTVTEHTKPQSSSSSYPSQDRNIYEGQQLDVFGQPVFGSTNFGGTPNHNNASQQSQSQSRNLFIPQDSFPTWDD